MVSQVFGAIIGSVLRAVPALLLLVTLLPAVSMVRTAAAKQLAVTSNTNVNTVSNGNEGANTNAAVSAETEAKTKELGTAVGGFWKLAWEKSWPFIKGTTLKFRAKIADVWRTLTTVFKEIGGSVKVDANANLSGADLVNVNGTIEIK